MSIPPPEQPAAATLPLPDPEAYPDEPREYARALMQRKDDIEKEIVGTALVKGTIGSLLTSRMCLTMFFDRFVVVKKRPLA